MYDIINIINSGNYSISTIRRKEDGKFFGCYFRHGSVKLGKQFSKSWWIEKENGDEELCLYEINENIYEIINVITEYDK